MVVALLATLIRERLQPLLANGNRIHIGNVEVFHDPTSGLYSFGSRDDDALRYNPQQALYQMSSLMQAQPNGYVMLNERPWLPHSQIDSVIVQIRCQGWCGPLVR